MWEGSFFKHDSNNENHPSAQEQEKHEDLGVSNNNATSGKRLKKLKSHQTKNSKKRKPQSFRHTGNVHGLVVYDAAN